MLSCEKASALTEKKTIFRLTVFEQIRHSMHLQACAMCRSYSEQSALIDGAIEKFTDGIQALELQPDKIKQIQEALSK